jgi:hypothetical protein
MVSVTTTGAPPAPAERTPAEHAQAATSDAAPASWFDLERQRARLEEFSATPPAPPGRNPFRFGSPPDRPVQPMEGRFPASRPSISDNPLPPAEPAVPVRLVGVATSGSSDVATRSAILSGLGQVFVAAAGDLVADRYRVTAVGEDAVELRDEATGRIVRLALR